MKGLLAVIACGTNKEMIGLCIAGAELNLSRDALTCKHGITIVRDSSGSARVWGMFHGYDQTRWCRASLTFAEFKALANIQT
jgi:hypothetical protein